MKTLLILAFCLYALPSKAVVIDTVVCLDHVKREATVHRNVSVHPDTASLPFEEANEIVCKRIKRSKRNKRGK